ncbi:MAG: fumarate hydratase C-terminal domain-containing protein [Anaerolineae bacterium]
MLESMDLGPEAVRMLEVEGFPAVVGYDTYGEDIYEIGRTRYRDAAIS